jgi:hypothetical protein
MIMVLNKYDLFLFDQLLYVRVCLQSRSQHVVFYGGHDAHILLDVF